MLRVQPQPLKSGVIEGFFGTPWGWPQRQACIEFLRQSGFQFYVYAPKSDPHLRRQWREPIPPQIESSLSQLSRHCAENGVSFGVGLSPFEIYREYGSEAKRDLRNKVRQIDRIGTDVLCILFDDMRGDVEGLAELQAQIVSDISTWTRTPELIFCPTYYSSDPVLERVFGPQPKHYLQDLSRLLDSRIGFFWTGERICSEGYSAKHLLEVQSMIGRKPFIWDNNITNDSKLRSKFLFMTPDAGAWSLPDQLAAGIAINPMNQPYLSFLALRGYAKLLGLEAQGAGEGPARDCFEACGPELRVRLREDLHWFQECGWDGMGEARRLAMLDRYASFDSNPYAMDIAAWLRGDYAFDPACLTA
jgi:hypothetical protein